MQSLFARMFLAFAVVTVGTTTLVSAYYDSSLAHRQVARAGLVADVLHFRAGDVLALWEADDHAGAEAALDALATETDLRLAIVDDAGHTLASAGTAVDVVPAGALALSPHGDEVARRLPDTEQTWFSTRAGRSGALRLVGVGQAPHHFMREVRLVLLVLVTALVSFVLARILTRPIRTLRDATHKIAAGDTSVRVGQVAGAGDEIAALAADFDRMTARIEDLLHARERLLRDVSHELRSPLARLQVALGIARQRATPELTPLLDRMERESERLGELISLVLSMARLEQAHEIATPSEVRLDELVRALASDASFEAEASDRAVRVVKDEPASVRGDAELLRQAAENVVRNAVRFAPPGTDVEIELERVNGSSVELRVRDHGPGVPETALGEIFRPFTRVDEARDRVSGGAGIGLAIAERAVRLHEGSVVAANAAGGGLVVTIRLPVLAATPA